MTLRLRIILLSLIIGIIYTLPHILFMIETKGNYKIVFAPDEQETDVYAGRIREVYDGHYHIADPYIYENKSKPYIRPYFSELVSGILGKIFHLPILVLLILNTFIIPVALFLLIFYFLFLFTKSQNLSLWGSSFILLANFPEIILHLTKGLEIDLIFSNWNTAYRYIFLILCLILTYKALSNMRILYIFLGVISFGSLFYYHPCLWTYIIAGYSLFFIYLIFKKSFNQLRVLVLITLIGLIISIPYWMNIFHFLKLPYFFETILRFGLYHSHRRQLLKLPVIGIFLFIFFYKKRDFNFYFISSFLIGGLLCMNQQVISGRNLASWSWYHYTQKEIIVIAGIVLVNNFFVRQKDTLQRIFKKFNSERIKRLFLTFSFILLILVGLYIQLSYYIGSKEEQKKKQFLYDAFLWLSNNTEVDSVVLASDAVSLILPVHTHNNVYIVRQIYESLMPDSEIMDRFFIFARLFGMEKDKIALYMMDKRIMLFGMKPNDPKYKSPEDFFRLNRVIENMAKKYEYFAKEDILKLLQRYRLDYIFYSPYEREIAKVDLNKYPFLYKVYDKGDIQIYKIKMPHL